MNEKLFQFIWQFQYFNNSSLSLTDGNAIKIIRSGELNTNQGPDFIAGEIVINNIRWIGNIELHINASDWYKHHHSSDKRYENIILHVIWENDLPVNDKMGNQLPTLVLQDRVANILLERYSKLMNGQTQLPCAPWLNTINDLVWASWKERLVIERLTKRANQLFNRLKQFNGDWERICLIQIARVFGGNINANSFESIIESIPVIVLKRHRYDVLQMEALLMGQSGLLQNEFKECYPLSLQKEYIFLKNKYSLTPIQLKPQFLRMRPASFPTIRLAQLAVFFKEQPALVQQIKMIDSVGLFNQLFSIAAAEYWDTHYLFENKSKLLKKEIGNQLKNNLLINAIVPLLFAYGLYHQNSSYQERAINLLFKLPAEHNTKLIFWDSFVKKQNTSFHTQALLELKQFYCDKKACLSCTIGNGILRKGIMLPSKL